MRGILYYPLGGTAGAAAQVASPRGGGSGISGQLQQPRQILALHGLLLVSEGDHALQQRGAGRRGAA